MVQLPSTEAVVVLPAVKPLPTIPAYGDNAIEVSNLTFSYRSDSSGSGGSSNRPDNVVLKDLNLSLPTGSRCLLIGANGSGKSVSTADCRTAYR
jgi:CCR4-NOT complex subunit CAF16